MITSLKKHTRLLLIYFFETKDKLFNEFRIILNIKFYQSNKACLRESCFDVDDWKWLTKKKESENV